jgi:hypothetical protein
MFSCSRTEHFLSREYSMNINKTLRLKKCPYVTHNKTETVDDKPGKQKNMTSHKANT